MEPINNTFIFIYEHLPEWVVSVFQIAAAISFLVAAYWQHGRGQIKYLWPLAVGVGGAMILMAIYFMVIQVFPETPLAVRRGGSYILTILLCLSLIAYNGGALQLSYDALLSSRRKRSWWGE